MNPASLHSTEPFPPNFRWGALTTAYQAEGAAFTDGRGLSVWDVFCRKEGVIHHGQDGSVSCDHYHHYKQDIALMRDVGLRTLRFSISWPRVFPNGTGTPNQKGLSFYDKYVDELLAAGIQPAITLFHWDYPYDLYCRGGWLSPKSPGWFADYTAAMVSLLGDRVVTWMTHNEPVGPIDVGMHHGAHAPGLKLSWSEVLQAGHHLLLSHGLAVQAMRAAAPQKLEIGMALCGVNGIPATGSEEDIQAAREGSFAMPKRDLMPVSWWADPAVLGTYPEDALTLFGHEMPKDFEKDLTTINQSLDFFGMNLYYGTYFRRGKNGKPLQVHPPQGIGRTSVEWPVTPEVMYWTPKFLHERYQLPIIITENGMANLDWISLDGKVQDPQRIDYLHRHLIELKRAMDEGIPVLGYWVWGILDNFEWNAGYKERFGMIYVDYATQKRIPKDSAAWYAEVIRTNGKSLSL